MTRRPALYPLPVDVVFNHPAYVVLPAAGRGMLLSLLENYWRGGCRWFPKSDDALFQWARAHRSTWRIHKAGILEVFNAARPELDAYHRKREGNRRGLVAAGQLGNATRRLKAIRDYTARELEARLGLPAAGVLPRTGANSAPRPMSPDGRPARARFAQTP
jgi:hypothetical protein